MPSPLTCGCKTTGYRLKDAPCASAFITETATFRSNGLCAYVAPCGVWGFVTSLRAARGLRLAMPGAEHIHLPSLYLSSINMTVPFSRHSSRDVAIGRLPSAPAWNCGFLPPPSRTSHARRTWWRGGFPGLAGMRHGMRRLSLTPPLTNEGRYFQTLNVRNSAEGWAL